jgi:hypothetical protein
LRVVWSRGYVLVSASENRGEVVLNFEPLMGSAGQVGWQRTIDLFPCASSRGTPTAPAVASSSEVEHRCY